MESLDQSLFVFINSSLENVVFDWLMPRITDLHKTPLFQYLATPLLLAYWVFRKRQKAVLPILGFALSIAAADLISYRLIKPMVQRPRPPAIEEVLKLRTDRYAGHSFPSNHAANNFAGATFLSLCYPILTPWAFLVAVLVGFSRVYVGVHYPFDVLAGALIGSVFGLFFFWLMQLILKKSKKSKWTFLQGV